MWEILYCKCLIAFVSVKSSHITKLVSHMIESEKLGAEDSIDQDSE